MLSARVPQRGLKLTTILLLVAVAPGCASVNLVDWKRFRVPTASAKDPVTRIVGIWEAAEGQGLDGKPTRGFAGQVLFFTHGKASPVRVDGKVTIDLFDGPANLVESADPIHRFDFIGDAWTIHLTDSVLGPSYNVFIPYTPKHSRRANCGLRVNLESSFGATAYSEMVHVALPGSTPQDSRPLAAKQPALAIDSRRPSADVKFGAALEQRTISLASSESDVPLEGVQPNAGRVIQAGSFPATSNAAQSRDEVLQQNLQHLENMLNRLKQQQQRPEVVPKSEPAATASPTGRRFQLTPIESTSDSSAPPALQSPQL